MFPAYNTRQLGWDDAVELARLLQVPIEVKDVRQDAYLARRFSGARIVVSGRLHQPTWGVFCVVHELAHHLIHPGPREFYLGSPAWLEHVETQANLTAWLALSPRRPGRDLPRILKIEFVDGLVRFMIAFVADARHDIGAPSTTRTLTLQRYT